MCVCLCLCVSVGSLESNRVDVIVVVHQSLRDVTICLDRKEGLEKDLRRTEEHKYRFAVVYRSLQ